MGVWNSHTSVGNILGSLIAGVYVSSAWGMSFIVPGLIIAATGVICFFFLIESKENPKVLIPKLIELQMFCELFNLIIQDLQECCSSAQCFFDGFSSDDLLQRQQTALVWNLWRVPPDVKLFLSSQFCCNFCGWSCFLSVLSEPEDVNCSPPQHNVSKAIVCSPGWICKQKGVPTFMQVHFVEWSAAWWDGTSFAELAQ